MNQIAPTSKTSVMVAMAERYGMTPDAFQSTLMKTVMPQRITPTKEEVAAFLLVAKEYDLNPMIREIYAFPKKGGGIQPIVSVDGYISLMNRNPNMDGVEFEDHMEDGSLSAVTCRIYRKDRSRHTETTEYMKECRPPKGDKPTPWDRWPRRMLRHKALIQCSRLAFGFSGLMDEDEYYRMESVAPAEAAPAPPPAPAIEQDETLTIEAPAAPQKPVEAEVVSEPPAPPSAPPAPPAPPEIDPDTILDDLDATMSGAADVDTLDEIWVEAPIEELDFPGDKSRAAEIYERHKQRLKK